MNEVNIAKRARSLVKKVLLGSRIRWIPRAVLGIKVEDPLNNPYVTDMYIDGKKARESDEFAVMYAIATNLLDEEPEDMGDGLEIFHLRPTSLAYERLGVA